MKTSLLTTLKKLQPVFLDTSCFIYTIEENPKYSKLTRPVLNAITDKELETFTSTITLGEVLVKPFKKRDYSLARIYHTIFTQTEKLNTISPGVEIAVSASKIAADYNLQLFDSFQLAIAQKHGCKSFLTNDKNLKKFKRLKVICLDDLKEVS